MAWLRFIGENASGGKTAGGDASVTSSGPKILPFSLYREDDFDSYVGSDLILRVDEKVNSMDEEACDPSALVLSGGVINRDNLQSGLNPIRKIDILPQDIFLLIKSQQKLISGEDHTATIATVCRQQSENRVAAASSSAGQGGGRGGLVEDYDFSHELFGGTIPSKAPRQGSSRELMGSGAEGDERSRGRSRSRSQSGKNKMSASANLDDGMQERSERSDTGNGSSSSSGGGQGNLRSRSMSGGPTRRTSTGTSASSGGSLRKMTSSSASSSSSSSSSSAGQSSGNKPPLPLSSGAAATATATTAAAGSGTAPTECVSGRSGAADEEGGNPFSTLSSIPPEVRSYFNGKLGPIDGIWLHPHPLSLLPPSYYKVLNNIQAVPAKDLPPAKRSEWELDLMREYDDTRMEKYEEFFTRCRKSPEKQLNKYCVKQDVPAKKRETNEPSRRRGDPRR
jgi:hypothetical protein